ncbi:hypothetical protein SAMN05216516_11912 [Izhakiella capsodis]|uniref:Uncharacterized protein n=1 Tax=Izhakiella capsodis TaxID=1367852 RepID=A0A1I5BMQ4_9GAMM|nr:hypothetical protein [Izhakiella capsodis]SFN75993.1 hypothetical protein SAMN05216516_11912 [Izhakiella capsodis]
MQIINYLRARLCNSSLAAFKLAGKDIRYINLANEIISVKNDCVKAKLEKLPQDSREFSALNSKNLKYDIFIKSLEWLKNT